MALVSGAMPVLRDDLSFNASSISTAVCFEHVGARAVLIIDRLVAL